MSDIVDTWTPSGIPWMFPEGGGAGSIQIPVNINSEEIEFLSHAAAMCRDTADRADCNRVIPTEHQRKMFSRQDPTVAGAKVHGNTNHMNSHTFGSVVGKTRIRK
jgi:hypothetical protein